MRKESFWTKTKLFLIFAGPSMLAFTCFVIFPFIYGIYLTLTSWDGISKTKEFVGLANYITTFQDQEFWTSIFLTFKYVVCVVILVNIIAFALACLLTSGIKGQNFLRAGFFTPNLIGGIVLGFIWTFIFGRVLPNLSFLQSIPIFQKSWLSDPNMAFWAIVVVATWQQSGYMLLIYIAGIVGVPKDYIEAASIDGANSKQITWYIRLPLMMQSFVICLFLTLTSAFKVYDLNLSLTEGGPYGTTKMASMTIFDTAFTAHQYGLGQAQAIVFFVIMLIVAVIQVFAGKSKEVEA
ncbi:MAG: ABC transporter permease [Clostridiales bacterium]|nr:MAG: ABC transporter permease [Clostridiales bacterium]HJA30510.1 sugar ABC transporter permease [Candidatus Eisenbergiella pullicola]